MGADGGVAFAKVYCDLTTAKKLLSPLGLLGVSSHSDVGEEANSGWLEDNGLGPNVVISAYGTDCGDNNGLLDLPDIIFDVGRAIDDGLETFTDMLLDYDTQPDWQKKWNDSRVSAMKRLDEFRRYERDAAELNGFLSMGLRTWLADVKRFIGPVQSEQTWT